MEIIELSSPDYDRIIELWERSGLAFRPQGRDSLQAFKAQLESGVQYVLGAVIDDRLVGVVLVTHDSRKGWINRLAVDPDFRRQGIGTDLIVAAEDRLQQAGIDIIAALVLEPNLVSQAVMENAGYVVDKKVLYFSKRKNSGS